MMKVLHNTSLLQLLVDSGKLFDKWTAFLQTAEKRADFYGVSFYRLLLTNVSFGHCAIMQRIIPMFGHPTIFLVNKGTLILKEHFVFVGLPIFTFIGS